MDKNFSRRKILGVLAAGTLVGCGRAPKEQQRDLEKFLEELSTGNELGALDVLNKHRESIPLNFPILCNVYNHLEDTKQEVELPIIALAASRGMYNLVQKLFELGANIEWKERQSGNTLLHYAVQDLQAKGKQVFNPDPKLRNHAVKKLLDKINSVENCFKGEKTPLELAILSANVGAVEALLRNEKCRESIHSDKGRLITLIDTIEKAISSGLQQSMVRNQESHRRERELRKSLVSSAQEGVKAIQSELGDLYDQASKGIPEAHKHAAEFHAIISKLKAFLIDRDPGRVKPDPNLLSRR